MSSLDRLSEASTISRQRGHFVAWVAKARSPSRTPSDPPAPQSSSTTLALAPFSTVSPRQDFGRRGRSPSTFRATAQLASSPSRGWRTVWGPFLTAWASPPNGRLRQVSLRPGACSVRVTANRLVVPTADSPCQFAFRLTLARHDLRSKSQTLVTFENSSAREFLVPTGYDFDGERATFAVSRRLAPTPGGTSRRWETSLYLTRVPLR